MEVVITLHFNAEKNLMPREDDMMRVASRKFIHLTTTGRNTGKLHTVKAWFAVGESEVFLSHEGKETDWMKNIKQNPQVTFEIGGTSFTGRARYIKNHTEEAWSAKTALYEKYYGKAAKEVIEDWFSLSKLITIKIEH
jgi:deazaflavin-dependent oxidoreductase (nitroreductase family)